MSKIALTPNGSGSGVFTIASPNSNTNRTITLPDESVTLGAGTPSIDDNGNATAITIDSSERVMLGVTTPYTSPTSSTNDGVTFGGAYTWTQVSDAGGQYVQRQNDGKFFTFHKGTASTPVGSIGTGFGQLVVGQGNTSVILDNSNTRFAPSNADGSGNDGNTTLGWTNRRWSDLYLSGGIYLGGTGSANKLSDVETGTWTPALNRTGSNYSYNGYQYGTYEKIGNLVVASFTLNLQSISTQGSSYNQLSGLPFTPSAYNANLQFVGSLGTRTVLSSASSFYWAGAIFFIDGNSTPIQTNFTTGFMSGFITYKTAS